MLQLMLVNICDFFCIFKLNSHSIFPLSFSAGVVALMLEASSHRLSPRDIAHILVETSIFPSGISSETNGAGKVYNDQIGFGNIDATQAVNKAANYPGIYYQEVCFSF